MKSLLATPLSQRVANPYDVGGTKGIASRRCCWVETIALTYYHDVTTSYNTQKRREAEEPRKCAANGFEAMCAVRRNGNFSRYEYRKRGGEVNAVRTVGNTWHNNKP